MIDWRIGAAVDANELSLEQMKETFNQGKALAFSWCGTEKSVVKFLENIGINNAKVYYDTRMGWAEVLVTRSNEAEVEK